MESFTVIGIAAGTLGIAATLGAAYAVLRSRMVRETVEIYRDQVEAQKRRIDTLEGDFRRCKERLESVEDANAALGEVVGAIRRGEEPR